MATHSSILAWRIPWREKPGRLQSMGSQRVSHNRASNAFTLSGQRKAGRSLAYIHASYRLRLQSQELDTT